MITVAKGGGGGSSEDAIADDFCYKYPEDKDCTGIDSLPMLLIVPRFNDYTNGSSLLGLGDIVCKSHKLIKSSLSGSSLTFFSLFGSAGIPHCIRRSFG
jgi:hypothetical protein